MQLKTLFYICCKRNVYRFCYGLEACGLPVEEDLSIPLILSLTGFFMKLFQTNNTDIITFGCIELKACVPKFYYTVQCYPAWQLVWCVIVTSCDCQLVINKGLLFIIKPCHSYFSFQLPSAVLSKCVAKFNTIFKSSQNQLRRMINNLR